MDHSLAILTPSTLAAVAAVSGSALTLRCVAPHMLPADASTPRAELP